jgi:hypothetical protein
MVRKAHDAWKSTAASVDQVLLRDGEDGGINKPSKLPSGVILNSLIADVEAIVIDCKVREVGMRGPPWSDRAPAWY